MVYEITEPNSIYSLLTNQIPKLNATHFKLSVLP